MTVLAAAGGGQPGALHNIDLITDLILQLRHCQPGLCCQWLYVLVLLDKCSPQVLSQPYVLCINHNPV